METRQNDYQISLLFECECNATGHWYRIEVFPGVCAILTFFNGEQLFTQKSILRHSISNYVKDIEQFVKNTNIQRPTLNLHLYYQEMFRPSPAKTFVITNRTSITQQNHAITADYEHAKNICQGWLIAAYAIPE